MCVQGQCERLRVSVSDCARARDLYYCARERASERASEREREREKHDTGAGVALDSDTVQHHPQLVAPQHRSLGLRRVLLRHRCQRCASECERLREKRGRGGSER